MFKTDTKGEGGGRIGAGAWGRREKAQGEDPRTRRRGEDAWGIVKRGRVMKSKVAGRERGRLIYGKRGTLHSTANLDLAGKNG